MVSIIFTILMEIESNENGQRYRRTNHNNNNKNDRIGEPQ